MIETPRYLKGKHIGSTNIDYGVFDVLSFQGDCHEFIIKRKNVTKLSHAMQGNNKIELEKLYTQVNKYSSLREGDIVLFTSKGFGLNASHSAEFLGMHNGTPLFLSKFGRSGRVLVTDHYTIFNRYQNLQELHKYSG